jgi:protein TonB
MSVALIGPDNARRSVVAKAVTVSEDRSVQEYASYPALAELPAVMETHFDIVMIDLDSDQSYALEIVEKIAAISDVTVMVYSTRNDPSLMMRCMRAGARDFLPIPADAVRDAEKSPQAVPEQASPARAAAPRAVDTVARQSTPEKRTDDPWDLSEKRIHEVAPSPAAGESQPRPLPRELRQSDRLPPDFKQWGSAPVRAASPAVVKAPAPTPRPVAAPAPSAAIKSAELSARSAAAPPPPDIFANPPLAIPRPPATSQAQLASARVSAAPPRTPVAPEPLAKMPSEPIQASAAVAPVTAPPTLGGIESDADVLALFRHGHHKDIGHPDEIEGRKVNWKKWALIAAGPVVLGLVVVLIFLRPSRPDTQVAHPAESVAPAAEESSATPAPALASQASKPVAKPSPTLPVGQANNATKPASAPEQAAPVSSDLMNAQLTAPSKISKDVKKTPPPVEVPATGLAPISMDDGTVVPGMVFPNGSKPKIAPVSTTLSAGVATGMLIHRVEPTYPQFAKDNHLGGTVVLRAKITKTGNIEDLHVVSGPKVFYQAAMEAVKNWKYKPYMLNNQPVEVETTVSLIFSLGQH